MIVEARRRLRNNLVEWRKKQFKLFPLLLMDSKIRSVNPLTPENEPLLLPSSFSEACRVRLGLESAAKAEYEMREGQAHDRLNDVRECIQSYNHHIAMKASNVRSQRHITRARGIVNNLVTDIQKPATHYNRTREALLGLGLSPDDPILRPLLDSELWAKNAAMPAKLGDSRKEDPWFWHVARPAGLSPAEKSDFHLESKLCCDFYKSHLWILSSVDRVKWFRDRSLRNRAREEREILEEEFKRTIRSYTYMQSVWASQGERQRCPGSRAYAHKQAAMMGRLARECTESQANALKKGEVYDKWYNSGSSILLQFTKLNLFI